MSVMCLIVYIQPGGNSPLWEQQSSDGRTAKLWSRTPTISRPPACLTRLASGGKDAARFLCLPGICLPDYLDMCVCDLNREIKEMDACHVHYVYRLTMPLLCMSVLVYECCLWYVELCKRIFNHWYYYVWLQILQLRSGGWTLDQIGSRIAQAMKQVRGPLTPLLS